RLLLLLTSVIPLLVLLSRRIGFEETHRWRDDLLDVAIALGVAAFVCPILLVLFGTLTADTPREEAVGKIALQMVPAAIGALLAKSQFGAADEEEEEARVGAAEESYPGELFLM